MLVLEQVPALVLLQSLLLVTELAVVVVVAVAYVVVGTVLVLVFVPYQPYWREVSSAD